MLDSVNATVATGLVTFSGIAAAWAGQLVNREAENREELFYVITMSFCAVLFAAATLLALLFLCTGGSGCLLSWSCRFAVLSTVVLMLYLAVGAAVGVPRALRTARSGSSGEVDLDEEARTPLDL